MSRTPSVIPTAFRARAGIAIWLVAGAALASGSARAQSASSTLSSYRTGYGGAGLSGLESPVNLSLIGAGSQFAISDGVNQAGAVGSVFAAQTAASQTSGSQTSGSQTSGGAGQTYTGVGQLAASNERAPLAVVDSTSSVASRSHDATTTVKASSTPAGPSAGAAEGSPALETATPELVLNGKVNLDGGQ